MHELSLAGSILEIVERAAARERAARVARVGIEVGRLAGVEVDALRFALTAIAPGTCLDGAAIDIAEPAGEAWCETCGRATPLAHRGDACRHCGGWQLRPTAGTALRVVELQVVQA
ncbi:MAG: hydrogenase maturation nickel metallochaperone HypA [Gammaproteobacteria bacterium]|uniref:hydrogenase maturation nickel metallochaperone HypA/HybF n=1 Tax=Azohydromonas sp. TaxID=1872666 RepID=UPI002C9E5CAF|nr:hydrogenase maturation nickel metallochaperone HypA [Azohydromonas sp.]HMM84178.1 hydrogenase maturation nickel metallochaperone HypA [Azohydromonas sp.]